MGRKEALDHLAMIVGGPRRGGNDLRRRVQRRRDGHQADDQPRPQDGLRMGHEREDGHGRIRPARRLRLPRPRPRPGPRIQRGHGAGNRYGSAQALRRRLSARASSSSPNGVTSWRSSPRRCSSSRRSTASKSAKSSKLAACALRLPFRASRHARPSRRRFRKSRGSRSRRIFPGLDASASLGAPRKLNRDAGSFSAADSRPMSCPLSRAQSSSARSFRNSRRSMAISRVCGPFRQCESMASPSTSPIFEATERPMRSLPIRKSSFATSTPLTTRCASPAWRRC